jgi:hypothetical protein
MLDGEAGGRQERVLISHGKLEGTRQPQHHFTTGLRAATFEEAQMFRGDVSIQSQLELTESTFLSPGS